MVTMAEVMQQFAPSYLKTHTVSCGQQRLIRDIQQCRSSALGDQWTACTSCVDIKVHHNSFATTGKQVV
ncbi:MAG: transposase zinc-binding domain-containing protein [Bacteroidetes bacterium]|nr:transposase zinc-binding domain-containing protein [Bacteroidota bacterium]